jgi:predicted ATPase
VEDLHWADPSTLELLSLIISQQRTQPIMLLASFRPEFSHSWPLHESVHEIVLGRLVPEQTTTVVNHVANNHALPPSILQQVVDRTGGVPLFIEEMTKTILESGYLKLENDVYELTGTLPPRVIPLTVQDSLMARLDRLGPEKMLAQVGATLGPEFQYDVLKAVAQAVLQISEEGLQQELARLVETDLMTQSGVLPRATYAFKHALIQDATYESLLRSTRRHYHQRIAEVLERDFPDVGQTQPELLAQHFTAAGSDQQALGYWEKAGQRALERAANAEAITHFGRALEYLQKVPEIGEHAREELQCHLSRGPALMYVKGYAAPEVKQCYSRAIELCEKMGETKELFNALWGQWASRFVGGDLGPARELGLQIVKLAESMNDPALLPPARHAFGYPLCYQAEYAAAIEQADAGIAVFDLNVEKQNSIDYQFSSTTALYNFSATAWWMLGYPEKALVRAEEALKLAKLIDRKPVLAFALTSSLWVYQLGRDAQSIVEAMNQFMTLSSDEQGYFWPSLARIFHGWARIEMGDLDNGVLEIRESWAAYQDIGGGVLRTHAFALLAEGLWKLGRVEEALDTISSGIESIKTSREYHYQPELYRIKGEILRKVHGNNSAEAETAFQQAVDLSGAQHTKWLELRAVMSRSALWCAQGRKDAARLELQQIYEWFTEGFNTRDLVEARNFLNQLE